VLEYWSAGVLGLKAEIDLIFIAFIFLSVLSELSLPNEIFVALISSGR